MMYCINEQASRHLSKNKPFSMWPWVDFCLRPNTDNFKVIYVHFHKRIYSNFVKAFGEYCAVLDDDDASNQNCDTDEIVIGESGNEASTSQEEEVEAIDVGTWKCVSSRRWCCWYYFATSSALCCTYP